MGQGRAGPKVGRRFRLCPAEEARGVQHRVPVGGPVRKDCHRGNVSHAVRRNVAPQVVIEPVEGESTLRRVVCSPSGVIAGLRQYGGPILQPVAQRRLGELALVLVGHRGEKGERAADDPHRVHLWRLNGIFSHLFSFHLHRVIMRLNLCGTG